MHPGPLPVKNAVFATVPGEDHTLGVTMAADFFRKDGWDVELMTGLEHDALVETICERGFPLIGLSLAGEHAVPALSRLIVALRIAMPASYIVVGGQNIHEMDLAIDAMGADAVVNGPDESKLVFDRIWSQISEI